MRGLQCLRRERRGVEPGPVPVLRRDTRVTGDVSLQGADRLRFSGVIGQGAQQRVRNVWATVR